MSSQPYIDLLIIGGGINGTGIACDAAGRNLSVHLCEQYDLASGTSSKSTKLIHGGLRYLEYFQFHLVHESLKEREILMRKAPHLIHPLSFVLPYHAGLRPKWLIQLGLFLYDHMAVRTLLPASKKLLLPHTPYGEPLKSIYTQGFMYSDCSVDDARLVIANALAAKEQGARISTYCKVVNIKRCEEYWQVEVIDTLNQQSSTILARAVINASGPWAQQFLQNYHIRLVKGSHIVVPKLYEGEHAYILQQTDKRVIFAIPYEQHWTLIGTTEVDYTKDPNNAEISVEEIDYLCQIINHYFKKSIDASQIVWSFAGIRPLFDKHATHEAKALSRDYAFEITDLAGKLPLLSVLGGKLTTYRILAQDALVKLKPYFPHMGPEWTAHAPLPGGDIRHADFNQFMTKVAADFPYLPQNLLYRLAHQYGTRIYVLLDKAQHIEDLGQHLGATLYEREIQYLKTHEWLRQIDDLLYRRTKLALHLNKEQIRFLRTDLT